MAYVDIKETSFSGSATALCSAFIEIKLSDWMVRYKIYPKSSLRVTLSVLDTCR